MIKIAFSIFLSAVGSPVQESLDTSRTLPECARAEDLPGDERAKGVSIINTRARLRGPLQYTPTMHGRSVSLKGESAIVVCIGMSYDPDGDAKQKNLFRDGR